MPKTERVKSQMQPPPGWALDREACSADATTSRSPTSSFGSRLRRVVWLAVSGPGMDAPRFALSDAQTCSAHRSGALPQCRVVGRSLRPQFLRAHGSACMRATLPSALRHAREGTARLGCLGRHPGRALSLLAILGTLALSGCGVQEAANEAHHVATEGEHAERVLEEERPKIERANEEVKRTDEQALREAGS